LISSILSPLSCLIALALLLLVAMALLSPFETLGWWAGWTKRELRPIEPIKAIGTADGAADYYIVYMTAIGNISSDISSRERRLLARLEEVMPGETMIVTDVFPFSATNNPLNGERSLAWLWQRIHNTRLGGRGSGLAALIFLRNLFQVAVSSDPRYGPIYNVGVARELVRSLIFHGYPPESGIPIAVMGWSGGGQIAVGVVPYLSEALQAPVTVVSIGGVMSADPGISDLEHLYHLQGSKDKFPVIGEILFPGRWPFMRHSTWYHAKQEGKISYVVPGPMRHTGKGDYYDRHAMLPNGESHVDRTAQVIAALLSGQEVPELPDEAASLVAPPAGQPPS
jgi:hypothetical protein